MNCFLLRLCVVALLITADPVAAEVRRLTCESARDHDNYCAARTQGHVELLEQLSRAGCTEGRTWGYDNDGVWVRNGCRGRFAVGWEQNDAAPRWERDANTDFRSERRPSRAVVCESRRGRYQRCEARLRGEVELRRQLSSAACIEDETWGFDRDGIWVDQGCRGEFVARERR